MGHLDLLDTLPGMFVVQVIAHSFVAAIIVDSSIAAWRIDNPTARLRMRLIVIIAPVLLFPIYQLINPERGSAWFRMDALFDTSRWLNLEIWGGLSGKAVLFFSMTFTGLVFLFQELIPIIRHSLAAKSAGKEGELAGEGTPVYEAIRSLPHEIPDVYVINDDDLVLFTSTAGKPAVVVSKGLAELLLPEELKAAIAHEIGHVVRGRRPLLVVLFLLRVLLFFNPVVLMEFRRVVQEEEKICDDFSAEATGDPATLAGALRKFSSFGMDPEHGESGRPASLRERLVEYSYAVLLEGRIARLENWSEQNMSGGWAAFLLALAAVCVINYFVV